MASAKNVLNELGYKSPGHLMFKMPSVSVPQNLMGSGATGREFGKKVGNAIASQIISAVKSAMGKGGAMPKKWIPFGDMEYKYGSGKMKGTGLFGSLGGMLGSTAGNALGGLFGFGKGDCECDMKGSGVFSAIADGFKAIPGAFGQVQNGISGAINNPNVFVKGIDGLVGVVDKAGQIGNKLLPYKGLVGMGSEQKGTGIFGDVGGMLGSTAGNALGGLFGFGMPKKMVVGRGGSQKIQIPKVYVDLAGRGKIEDIAKAIASELGGYIGSNAEDILGRVVKGAGKPSIKGEGSRTVAGRVRPGRARRAGPVSDIDREEVLDRINRDLAELDDRKQEVLDDYNRMLQPDVKQEVLDDYNRMLQPVPIKLQPVPIRAALGRKKKVGRPKGSKNVVKRKVGRPKGSKNKGKGVMKTSA